MTAPTPLTPLTEEELGSFAHRVACAACWSLDRDKNVEMARRLVSEVRVRRAAPDRIEADAAGVGLRTALGEIDRAVQILDESEWSKLSREKFTEVVRRAFTVLCNAAELTRACFVASVPREPPPAGAAERDEKGAGT